MSLKFAVHGFALGGRLSLKPIYWNLDKKSDLKIIGVISPDDFFFSRIKNPTNTNLGFISSDIYFT